MLVKPSYLTSKFIKPILLSNKVRKNRYLQFAVNITTIENKLLNSQEYNIGIFMFRVSKFCNTMSLV